MGTPIDNLLIDWLDIATKKLVPSAQERIWQEIEAHYSEAVAAHLIAGQSEADAQANALMELGDAKKAGKRFRRQCLTESEANTIEKLKWKGGIGNLMRMLSLFALLSWSLLWTGPIHKHQLACFILLFLIFVVAPVFTFIRSRRVLTKRHIIQILAANVLELIVMGLFTILTLKELASIPIALFVFLVLIIQFSRYLRILNKVRKAAPGWDGTPPQALIST